ncbi:ROK family protein [Gracilibacillus sp. HCP3S3_G5_1]|uniref:ROK family protein n=1 Tax=unclassified Gracilibacillus TaxID=2625209 RepID=UPI003F8A1FB1
MLKYFLKQTSSKYNGMKQIYQYIHTNGPVTKATLVEQTQMKQTTVTRHLENLLAERFIQISQYEESSGGRPPALFEIEPNAGYIIGVDLSRIESTISLVNMSFEIVDSFTFAMTEKHTPSYTIQLIKERIEHFLEKHHISRDLLLGIGIGTVGPLDRENGVILEPEAFIASGWKNISILDELKSLQVEKVLLENGANVATLHTYSKGLTADPTILYCISGRGLRCGVLTEGHILKNKTGDASSFGEMIMDIKERRSLASFISYDYLLHEVNERYLRERSRPFSVKENENNQKELMDLFKNALSAEDPIVQQVVLESAVTYGIGIANMVNVLHPDQVILSSELMETYPPYFNKIVDTAKQYIYRMELEPVQFKMEKEKKVTISTGAAILVFQSYFS